MCDVGVISVQVVESSQPGEDTQEEGEDVLMPLCVGRQFSRSAVRRAEARSETRVVLSETCPLGVSIQPPVDPAPVPEQRSRVSRRTKSQGPCEITPVVTTRRHSLGTDAVGSTTRQGDGLDEPKPKRSVRGSRKTAGEVGSSAAVENKANEVIATTRRRTRCTDVESQAEPVKKAKLSIKEQNETKTRSVRSGTAKKPLVSAAAGRNKNETADEEGTGEVIQQNESETRSKRRSVGRKPSITAAQEESENVSGVRVKQKLLTVGKQAESIPRSTRTQKSVVNNSPIKEENETNIESKPRSVTGRKSASEKQLPTGENETSDSEPKAKPAEVSQSVSRTSKRTAEKPTMTVRGRRSEKSTVPVTGEQEETNTKSNKTKADKEPSVGDGEMKGSRQSARRRTSLVPEDTQPKKRTTASERESESKTRSARKLNNPPEAERTDSEPRLTGNRRQTEEKPAKAAKQKESKTNTGDQLSSQTVKQTESKRLSKRNRESIVGKQQDSSMPQGKKNARRSSVNVANKESSQVKVKAKLHPPESPKQKENVPVGKSPKRRQTSLPPASDGVSRLAFTGIKF